MSRSRCYWAGTGTHQAEFKRLRTALVPVGGASETPHGELLRAVGTLYFDLRSTGLANVKWDDWHTVYAHRDLLIPAIGRNGDWVFAVVERAVTERCQYARSGIDGGASGRSLPYDAFERLVDGCVLAVQRLDRAA